MMWIEHIWINYIICGIVRGLRVEYRWNTDVSMPPSSKFCVRDQAAASSWPNQAQSCQNSWRMFRDWPLWTWGRWVWNLANCGCSSIVQEWECRGTGKSWKFGRFHYRRRRGASFRPILRRCSPLPKYPLPDCTVSVPKAPQAPCTKESRFSEWVSWWASWRHGLGRNRRFWVFPSCRWVNFGVWGPYGWSSWRGSS